MRSKHSSYTLNPKYSCSASKAHHSKMLAPKDLSNSIPYSLDDCSSHGHTSGLSHWLQFHLGGLCPSRVSAVPSALLSQLCVTSCQGWLAGTQTLPGLYLFPQSFLWNLSGILHDPITFIVCVRTKSRSYRWGHSGAFRCPWPELLTNLSRPKWAGCPGKSLLKDSALESLWNKFAFFTLSPWWLWPHEFQKSPQVVFLFVQVQSTWLLSNNTDFFSNCPFLCTLSG